MTDQQTPVLEKPVQTPPPAAPTGPRKKKRKSKLKLVVGLLVTVAVIAAVAVALWYFVFRENNEKGAALTDVVQIGSIQATVEGSGMTRARNSASVTPGTGTILELFVQEGDQVQEGQQLYRMDDTTAREAVTAVVGAGIITGVDGNGTFNGNGVMTRAQAATVMCRFIDVMTENGAPSVSSSSTEPTTPAEPITPTTGLGQKLSSGATAAAGVLDSIGKDDAYPTYGNSDVVSNNGYFTGAPNTDIGNAQLEYEFLDWVNEARVAEGHEPLTWVTSDAAEEHTLQRCYELVSDFTHERPKGKFAAEDIASGYFSAESVFDAWMNSPGHKRTLMGDKYKYLSAARAGNYWIICVWSDSGIKRAETWAHTNYDYSSLKG